MSNGFTPKKAGDPIKSKDWNDAIEILADKVGRSGAEAITGPLTIEGNVGIGTTSPSRKLHVMGNRIRLENGGKILDMRADGGAVDLQTETNHLYIRSVGHHVFINPMSNDGKVGIGTKTPKAKLEVKGGLLSEGDSGPTPVSGAGRRLMWIPEKAAFRAGEAEADSWDDGNIGNHSAAVGKGTVASGICSTAMGYKTEASGHYSVAMGYKTKASGYDSTAMGYETSAQGSYSATLGLETKAIGASSTAMGRETEASGHYSAALGWEAKAIGDASTAMGRATEAVGNYSSAMGSTTRASGHISTAMGFRTEAMGYASAAMGYETSAQGSYSTAMGNHTVAQAPASLVIGQYNDTTVSPAPLFAIGNGGGTSSGTIEYSNALTAYKNGNLHIQGNYENGNQDYAEYFESTDGKSIPPGTAVALENGKVRPAKKGDTPIGIISASPVIVGGVYIEWPKKYLRDEYGSPIMEEYREEIMVPKREKVTRERQKMEKKTITEKVACPKVIFENGKYIQREISETVTREVTEPLFREVDLYDADGKRVIGKHQVPIMETYEEEEIDVLDENGRPVLVGSGEFIAERRPKLNPEYDRSQEYIPRERRPEWNCVGLLGQLRLRKGQPVADSWIKIRDVSKQVELWLVK